MVEEDHSALLDLLSDGEDDAADHEHIVDDFDDDAEREKERKAKALTKKQQAVLDKILREHYKLLGGAIHDISLMTSVYRLYSKLEVLSEVGNWLLSDARFGKASDYVEMLSTVTSVLGSVTGNGETPWTATCTDKHACLFNQVRQAVDQGHEGRVMANSVLGAWLHASGFHCRLVSSLSHISHLPSKLKILFEENSGDINLSCPGCTGPVKAKGKRKRSTAPAPARKQRKSTRGKVKVEVKTEVDAAKKTYYPRPAKCAEGTWVEVYDAKLGRWIPLDAFYNLVDAREFYSANTHDTLVYCVAMDCSTGMLTDVTRRYAEHWSAVLRQRLHGVHWLPEFLTMFNSKFTGAPSTIDSLEEQEMECFIAAEPIPKKVEGLRNHPLYCIDKFIKKYEAIYPLESCIGQVGKHKVYPISSLHTLHTRERWMQNARVVLPDEEPYKILVVKPTRAKGKSPEEEEEERGLFGVWQTDEWVPEPFVDGIIPRNERGNIELWTPAHLPPGAVHLNLPRVAVAARKLGVNHATAMTGFSIRGWHWVPVIEGIVVAEDLAEVVLEAHDQLEEWKREKEHLKYSQEMLGLWRRLLTGVVSYRNVINEHS